SWPCSSTTIVRRFTTRRDSSASRSRGSRVGCRCETSGSRRSRPEGGGLSRYVMIAVGGAIGAIARYQVAAMVQARVPVGFPYGTFLVNVSGGLIRGFVTPLLTDRLVVHPNCRYLLPIVL